MFSIRSGSFPLAPAARLLTRFGWCSLPILLLFAGRASAESTDAAAVRAHVVGAAASLRDVQDVEEFPSLATPAPRTDPVAEWMRRHRAQAPERLGTQSAAGRVTPAAPSDAIGGDDIFIMASEHIAFMVGTWSMDIAENGDIYAAVEVADEITGWEVRVYRSLDGGTEWTLWGTRENADPDIDYHTPSIHVAEGTENRVYVAYEFENGAADRTVNVAYSEANLASATWIVRTVFSQAGVNFEFPSLSSDEVSQAGYKLIVAVQGDDGDGDDIWFSRSTDFGTTWDAEYRIGTRSAGNDDYRYPEIRYGRNGTYHCVWTYSSRLGAFDDAVRYRRALNDAAAAIADWQALVVITSTGSGSHEYGPSVSASHGSDQVIISYVQSTLANLLETSHVRKSGNAGSTWPAIDIADLDVYGNITTRALPGTDGFRLVPWDSEDHGIQRADDATPLTWSALENFTDFRVNDPYLDPADFDYDLTHGNQLGAIWVRFGDIGQLDTLFFDAEWRRDPGYPNLEPGFPIASTSAQGPPLITELDGDPQSEIVYPDVDGFVHAMNHDGTELAGWPISVIAVPQDGTVAAADLDGDGLSEVVVGNTLGNVYAWYASGTALPNFPVDLGTGWDTYCSIGALLPDSRRQIVATSANGLFLILPDGSTAPGFPRVKAAFMYAPAAIGDIDDDGDQDMVTVFSNHVQSNDPTGALGLNRTLPVGKTATNQASLADLDLNGDLEIAVPTDQGDVYVMHHDGLDHAGWPYVDAGGDPITSVAMAQLAGTGEPELAFSVNYRSFLKFQTGADVTGWPHDMVFGIPVTAAPTIDDLDGGSSDVLGAALWAYGWKNLSNYVPGWPRYFDARICEVSPASGDIDNDGDVEALFFATGALFIYDMNSPVDRADPRRVWPMYGYNAGRTACLACGVDEIVSVPGRQVTGVLGLALLSSNPSRGAVELRLDLPTAAAVRLGVFDAAGRSVRALVKSEMPAGAHRVSWDGFDGGGRAAPSGMYYLKLTAASPEGTRSTMRKVVFMK